MRLTELVASLPTKVRTHAPDKNPDVHGISHDSRRIGDGDLYVAIIGANHDGRHFAPQAVARGAVAVLGPGDPLEPIAVPWVTADQPRHLLGPLAARLYGHPDRDLTMVGVTGTNGKSTVVALIAAILDTARQPAGCLGTLGNSFRQRAFPELDALGRTTPEASDLFRVLATMKADGARAAVMEVSSHALDQGRVAGASFDVAVFTNLTRDHLDYHGDLESYFAVKRRLFDQRKVGARAVVNVDDAFGRRLATSLGDVLTFGTDDPAGADVYVRDADLRLDGTRAEIATPRGDLAIETGLLGRFNLANTVAAVASAEALELDQQAVVEALARQRPVVGRLEPIDHGQGFPILIDFAHTPGALEAASSSLRELWGTDRRIVVVFGCGGEKDQGKRAPMGQAVGKAADFAIATSDNPRDEDPADILSAVEEGLRAPGGCAYRIEPDREAAIRTAIEHALGEPGQWAVLIAGKGHEQVQVIGERHIPFSDHDCVARALLTLGAPRHDAGSDDRPDDPEVAHG